MWFLFWKANIFSTDPRLKFMSQHSRNQVSHVDVRSQNCSAVLVIGGFLHLDMPRNSQEWGGFLLLVVSHYSPTPLIWWPEHAMLCFLSHTWLRIWRSPFWLLWVAIPHWLWLVSQGCGVGSVSWLFLTWEPLRECCGQCQSNLAAEGLPRATQAGLVTRDS